MTASKVEKGSLMMRPIIVCCLIGLSLILPAFLLLHSGPWQRLLILFSSPFFLGAFLLTREVIYRRLCFSSHSWDGCKCHRCSATRDMEHDWNGCSCRRCPAIRNTDHGWDGCKCRHCSKIRDLEHRFIDSECRQCGYCVHGIFACNCSNCNVDHIWHDNRDPIHGLKSRYCERCHSNERVCGACMGNGLTYYDRECWAEPPCPSCNGKGWL